MTYFSVIHKIIGTLPIRFETNETNSKRFCIVFLLKEKVNRKREMFMIREQEEKIREEVDSEEEWRAIITSTDNGKKLLLNLKSYCKT